MATSGRTWQASDTLQGSRYAPKALPGSIRRSVLDSLGETKLQQVFFNILLLYIYMFVSRLPEIISVARIGVLLQPILLVGLIMTNQLAVLTKSRAGQWLIGLTLWIAACVPTSVWIGGSAQTLFKSLQALLLVAFLLAFVQSYRDVTKILLAIGLASGTISILSFVAQGSVNNRLGFGGSSTLADPNFFALYILIGTSFLTLVAFRSHGLQRILALFLILVNLGGVMRSGSRGGMLALLVGGMLLFAFGSRRQRKILTTLGITGLVAAFVLLPSEIRHRFTDYFATGPVVGKGYLLPSTVTSGGNPWEEGIGMSEAQASTAARKYLIRRGIQMTFKHPVFGLGPEQFQVGEAADAALMGIRGAWHFTHNTYLQYSSECGIPGLVLFLGSCFSAFRGIPKIRKRGPSPEIRQIAIYMQISFTMLMIGAAFLTLGYGGMPYVIIGVMEAFKRVAARQQKILSVPVPQAQLAAVAV